MVDELIQKYIWIIDTLHAAGDTGLTINEICDRYESEFREDYSRSSFNHHRTAIENVFGFEILCNRSTNRYYIPFQDDVIDDSQSKKWIINTFTINNLLTLGKERLSGRVSVENIPSGHKYLATIIEAMKKNCELIISYQKYNSNSLDIRHLQPFAVKEFEKRWYVIGYSAEPAALRVYALDRIKSMEMSDKSFSLSKDFDVNDLFYDSFGVYLPQEGQKAETILFTTNEKDARYLRDLPIHHSQTEIDNHDGKITFRIRVIPNDNFIMNICKYGSRIEIIDPPSIREKVIEELRKAYKQYEN